MLIRLNHLVHVDAYSVESVTVNEDRCKFVVRTRSGDQFEIAPDYRKGVFETHERILKDIATAVGVSARSAAGA